MPLSDQEIDVQTRWLTVFADLRLLTAYARRTNGNTSTFTDDQIVQEIACITKKIMRMLDPKNPEPAWL